MPFILIIFSIFNTDLPANFIFDARNGQTFVMCCKFAFDFAGSNTISHFVQFISQATDIGWSQFVLCLWQRPWFYRSINIKNFCRTIQDWHLNEWHTSKYWNWISNTETISNDVEKIRVLRYRYRSLGSIDFRRIARCIQCGCFHFCPFSTIIP